VRAAAFRWPREIFWFLLFAGFFLFTPLRIVRALVLGALVYRGIAAFCALYLPSKLEILLSDSPFYATLHRPFTLELELINNGFFPLPHFTVEARSSGLFFIGPQLHIQPITGKGKRTLTFQMVGDSRGRHYWGPFIIKGSDPLRLFHWERVVYMEKPVILYPTVFSMNLSISRGLTGGSLAVQNRMYENVTSFQALRKYQAGDELKRINWKASARLGELYSNIYDCSLYFPVQIILNLCEEEYPLSHRTDLAERAIAAAASLALHYLNLKQSVGLISSGCRDDQESPFRWIPAGAGQDHSGVILEELAAIQLDKKGKKMQQLFNLPQNQGARGTKYILISPPLLSEDLSFIREQHRLGKDLELFMVSGLKTHRKHISNPGMPCYILNTRGGRPIREY